MPRVHLVPFLLATLTLLAAPAFAYGPAGHQMVGAIADRRLAATPAGQKVKDLLDGMTLEEVSVIPDSIKGWDKNGPDDPGIFHYSAHPRIDAALNAYWKANPPNHDVKSPIPSTIGSTTRTSPCWVTRSTRTAKQAAASGTSFT